MDHLLDQVEDRLLGLDDAGIPLSCNVQCSFGILVMYSGRMNMTEYLINVHNILRIFQHLLWIKQVVRDWDSS